MTKEIKLTHGKYTIVDDGDFERLNQYKWRASIHPHTCYVNRSIKNKDGKWKMISMHHEIIGIKEGFITDHINGNGLDNRRCNLRHVTPRQNTQNLHRVKSSKYPGVCWCKASSRWISVIGIKKTKKYLGSFLDEEDAYYAYCRAVEDIGETVIKGKYARVGSEIT
jgi:hypothetical protein